MRCAAATITALVFILQATLIRTQGTPAKALLPTRTGSADNIVFYTASPNPQPKNHIDSIINAAESIIEEAFPTGIPPSLNFATVRWPTPLVIGATTYTGHPWASTTLKSSATNSDTTSISTQSETPSTSSSSNAASEPRSNDNNNIAGHGSMDIDRAIAIIAGLLISMIAVATAAGILYLVWRRKKQTGQYFKPARCSVCTTTSASFLGTLMRSDPSTLRQSRNVTPWRLEPNEPARSWFAKDAYKNGRQRVRPMSSAERLPEVVGSMYDGHVHPVYGRGGLRLQKSNSTLRRGMPDNGDMIGPMRPHELNGDDLAAINELDGESPVGRSNGRWSTTPFLTPSQTDLRAAARHADAFVSRGRANSYEPQPHADQPYVVITKSPSVTETDPSSGRGSPGGAFSPSSPVQYADILPGRAYSPPQPPPQQPLPQHPAQRQQASRLPPPEDETQMILPARAYSPPDRHQRRELALRGDENLPEVSPEVSPWDRDHFGRITTIRAVPARDRTHSPVPFSPVWRQGRPSPVSGWFPNGGASGAGGGNGGWPDRRASVSPASASLRRGEEGDREVLRPSFAEMTEFDFEGAVSTQHPHWDGSDDGWRPSPTGRYELAS